MGSNEHKCNAGLVDYGKEPMVTNINNSAKRNNCYRTALWTGEYLQLTLMSIPVDGEIGLEVHTDTDQYIRVESGCGIVLLGNSRNNLPTKRSLCENNVVFVPAGTWHNVVNAGVQPLKISTVYAPPHHRHGTVQSTKEIADAEEHSY